jgi:hypothetical protein
MREGVGHNRHCGHPAKLLVSLSVLFDIVSLSSDLQRDPHVRILLDCTVPVKLEILLLITQPFDLALHILSSICETIPPHTAEGL